MPTADGRNLGGDKVKFFYLKGAVPPALRAKIVGGNTVSGDIVGSGKAVEDANELKGVDDISEYGSETESQTEQPYGNSSFNVLGTTTLADADVTYMPDLSEPIDKKFAVTDKLGEEVLFVEQLTGNTPANKTYNVILGNLGGVRRVANKNGSQRYRRRIIVAGIHMGIPQT